MVLYDRTNTERLSALEFGTLRPDASSQEIIVWLWNKKDFPDAPTGTDVRVSALSGNPWAEGIITGKHLKVKSDGVLDPDSKGIVDDAETQFTAIGGSLTNQTDYHAIGDIPANCARRLYFRIDVPADFVPKGPPRLLVQVGFLSEPVVWLYVADS